MGRELFVKLYKTSEGVWHLVIIYGNTSVDVFIFKAQFEGRHEASLAVSQVISIQSTGHLHWCIVAQSV